MMSKKIHINCDMGESFGRYQLTDDAQLMTLISACNIACGFHAGDPKVMEETIQKAISHEIEIGAHPSYPDRQGFGRRTMHIESSELQSMVKYQIAALKGMVESYGKTMTHVKPHGALYNYACIHQPSARAIAHAIKQIDQSLILFAPFNSHLAKEGAQCGLTIKFEAFVDRRYTEDGTLVSRRKSNAVIKDPKVAKAQVLSILEDGEVSTSNGNVIEMKADTFCIHGDNPAAMSILEYIHDESR